MQLQPRRQPGRTDRKAAVYASEILRLRAEGYTFEAIREALADVGIALSTSALRREVRRHRQPSAEANSSMRPVSGTPTNRSHSSALPTRPSSLIGTNGREIAEAFFNAHPSNPLLRVKETQ